MPINVDKEKNNPCLKEQDMVYKCLAENDYNNEKCQNHYKNYRNCKDFWGKVQSERRSRGIRPLLPPVEERAQIKAEYIARQKTQST